MKIPIASTTAKEVFKISEKRSNKTLRSAWRAKCFVKQLWKNLKKKCKIIGRRKKKQNSNINLITIPY